MFIEILVRRLVIRQQHLGVFYMFLLCAEGKGNPTFAPAKSHRKIIFLCFVFVLFFFLRMETSCNTSMTHYWLVWKTLVFFCIPFLFLIPASFPVFVFIVFRFALCLQYSDFLPDALNSLMYSRNLVWTCWTFTWQQIVINKMSTYQSLVRTYFGQTVLFMALVLGFQTHEGWRFLCIVFILNI